MGFFSEVSGIVHSITSAVTGIVKSVEGLFGSSNSNGLGNILNKIDSTIKEIEKLQEELKKKQKKLKQKITSGAGFSGNIPTWKDVINDCKKMANDVDLYIAGASDRFVKKSEEFVEDTVDLVQGVGAGVLENVTYGTSNTIESSYKRNNEIRYTEGKIIGDGITMALGGPLTAAGATATFVTSPTGAGELVFAPATVYAAGVTAEAAGHAFENTMMLSKLMKDNSGRKSAGEGNKACSNGYETPTGGGGVTSQIKVGDTNVTLGHGGRHLEGTGLSVDEVNNAIAQDIANIHPGTGKFYKGRIEIEGQTIEYTSYGTKNGEINIGTYYPVK